MVGLTGANGNGRRGGRRARAASASTSVLHFGCSLVVAANYTSEQSGIAQAGKCQRFSCLFKRIAQADAQGPLLK